MKLTRNIINKFAASNEWLLELETLLAEIEANVEQEPDISIESCKSLLESIAKNILVRLDASYSTRDDIGQKLNALLKQANKVLAEKNPNGEYEAITRFNNVAHHIAEIRNDRGDISHGKALPKEFKSSIYFAESIKAFTDGFASYLLYLFLEIDLSYKNAISYDSNPDFNEYLDQANSLPGISYSKALFEQDIVAYEELLSDYQDQFSVS